MNSCSVVSQKKIDKLLNGAEKAGRYIGGEINSIVKDTGVACRIALAFPDVYEVAESHLGCKILYHVVNQVEEYAAERVYAMWPDMEVKARQAKIPLWSLETHRPLSAFDVVGFSLQYELSYPTLVGMLEHGQVTVRSSQRREHEPIVIAGGAGAYNPEPIAPFIDAFLLGDGEEAILDIMEVVRSCRAQNQSRTEILLQLARLPGIYVPSHFEMKYDGLDVVSISAIPGTPAAGTETKHGTPRISRCTVVDLDNAPYPTKPIIPNVKPIHDRIAVEVQRGCSQGCRFCQAGMITRPTRQRKPETVLKLADEALANTGSGEVGLMSLSVGDYEPVNHVLTEFFNKYQNQGLSVGLPSMRTETMTPELAEQVARVRKSGFTFAPEAGSERLRRVINKTNSEKDLINAVEASVRAGWTHLKFYFMIGLPTETFADLDAIVNLADRARAAGRQIRGNTNVTVSVSTFVPKPHTSFQWDRQITLKETIEKQSYLRAQLKQKKINFRYHSPEQSFLEGILSRGDSRLANAIERAAEAGCRLDAWSENHNHQKWMTILNDSLSQFSLKPDDYLVERKEACLLPWDHLDAGILKKFLRRDRKASLRESTIEDCALKDYCYACGGCDLGDPYLKKDAKTGIRNIQLKPDIHSKPTLAILDNGSNPHDDFSSAPGNSLTNANPESKIRLRYRFAKLGRGMHISHLDMIEVIQRAVRMAEIPVLHSNGPRPRMKLAFSPACPTGIESECEYFDIYCRGDKAPKSYAENLQRWLPQGMAILNFDEVPWKSPAVNSAIVATTYRVHFDCMESVVLREKVEAFVMSDEYLVNVTRKKSKKLMDARSYVQDVAVVGAGLHLKLMFSATGTLKIREAIACIVGLDFIWDCTIRKISTDFSDTANTLEIDSPVASPSSVIHDIRIASSRPPVEDSNSYTRPRESRVVPYAE